MKKPAKIYGKNAAKACLLKRPQAVFRAYISQREKIAFTEVMKALAKNRIAYHLVTDDELIKISESDHHEGITLYTDPILPGSFKSFLEKNKTPTRKPIVLLDGVQNPNNIGAILRNCAHFGVENIFFTKPFGRSLSGSTSRNAEGALEWINAFEIELSSPDVRQFFSRNDLWVTLLPHETLPSQSPGPGGIKPVSVYQMPKQNLAVSPFRIIGFGSESKGLSDSLRRIAKQAVSVPGSRRVESLNVSVTVALLLLECCKPT